MFRKKSDRFFTLVEKRHFFKKSGMDYCGRGNFFIWRA